MAPNESFRVDRGQLTNFVVTLLERMGTPSTSARRVAGAVVAADARGFRSHGIAHLPYYQRLVRDGLDPAGLPEVVAATGAIAVVNGHNGFGHLAAELAMETAISCASRFGIGAVAVFGSNHCGAMSVYSLLALRSRMVGVAMTNAMPTMAPWGGRERLLGINPVAIAIPAGSEQPFVLDISFATAARGRISLLAERSLPLPEGWAFDAEGVPTVDAQTALFGLLNPIGQYKGAGLALAVGLLSTALSGAAFGSRLGRLETGPVPGADGHLMMAIDVGAFTEHVDFEQRVDDVLHELKSSQPAAGFTRVTVPGEMSAEEERKANTLGVLVEHQAAKGLRELASELDVVLPEWLRDVS